MPLCLATLGFFTLEMSGFFSAPVFTPANKLSCPALSHTHVGRDKASALGFLSFEALWLWASGSSSASGLP